MAGILLVHGAWHGPWCWDGLAERLRGNGHQVQAVRLRGHDGSPGRIWHRVHHYVQDVAAAAARFPEPPVLVGHSTGTLVIQKHLERNPGAGAVLLAPFPRWGTTAAVARLAARHPLLLAKATLGLRLWPLVATPALARELFFTPATPQALVEEVWGRLQDESYLMFLDTMVIWARPRRVQVPVLVVGAEHDWFFTVGETRRLAAAYRTQAQIMTGMGHDLMLDQGWQQVADRIDTWVRGLGR
jgi:pimeloyl-ACP methyl ester carboxylesterase